MPGELRWDRTIARCLAEALTEVCTGRDPQPVLARWVSRCCGADWWGWGRLADPGTPLDLHVSHRPLLPGGPGEPDRAGPPVLYWLQWRTTGQPPWGYAPDAEWCSVRGWDRFSRALGQGAGPGEGPTHVLWFARAHALTPDETAGLRLLGPPVIALVHLRELLGDGVVPEHRGAARQDEQLSAREQQVLVLLAQGLPAKTIASRLQVSVRTVHCHLQHIYHKLGAHDRLSAVLQAQRAELLPGSPARALLDGLPDGPTVRP